MITASSPREADNYKKWNDQFDQKTINRKKVIEGAQIIQNNKEGIDLEKLEEEKLGYKPFSPRGLSIPPSVDPQGMNLDNGFIDPK